MKSFRLLGSLMLMTAMLLGSTLLAGAQKKVIIGGWNTTMLPSSLSRQVGQLQNKPFDGVILTLKSGTPSIFTTTRWAEADIQGEETALQNMAWGRLTDNFLIVWTTSSIDWFSDSDWSAVLNNIGVVAKAARIGHCKGIIVDPEPYPWTSSAWYYKFQSQYSTKSFNDYQTIVRKRGAQFMSAIQAQFPNPVIHWYYLLDEIARLGINPRTDSSRLSLEYWGLLPAFLNGMLDTANPGTVIDDGNEVSYYYTTPTEFLNARNRIRYSNANLAAPEDRTKYQMDVKVAPALYPDYIFNQLPANFNYPMYSAYMTAAEQQQWWEHNVYYALSTSNRYVWLYAEQANFFNNANVPAGLYDGITSAKGKIAAGQPLGFSIDAIMARVKPITPKP